MHRNRSGMDAYTVAKGMRGEDLVTSYVLMRTESWAAGETLESFHDLSSEPRLGRGRRCINPGTIGCKSSMCDGFGKSWVFMSAVIVS